MKNCRNRSIRCVLLLLMLSCWCHALSQESRREMCIDFCAGSDVIDSAYSENSLRLREIRSCLHEILQDSALEVLQVSFCGAASPEGSYQLNHELARDRMAAVESLIRREIIISDDIVTRNDGYIPWTFLQDEIEASDLQLKDTVISILREESMLVDYHREGERIDRRVVKLQQLDGGNPWREINRRFFSRMRKACVVITTRRKPAPPRREPSPLPEPEPEPEPDVAPVAVAEPPLSRHAVEPQTRWTRRLHLKTNLVGWGMAIANIAAEIDLNPHWSFALPVYYSAWDYFKATIKMRTFAIQPEVRYWLSDDNEGFFGGVHFGMAYYNVAFDGEYRRQDHSRRTPALGGGISLGYRRPIGRSRRWHFETSLGAGVYALNYDKFYNTPRTSDGLLVGNVRKTFWCIDRVAVSFTYMFDLNGKSLR